MATMKVVDQRLPVLVTEIAVLYEDPKRVIAGEAPMLTRRAYTHPLRGLRRRPDWAVLYAVDADHTALFLTEDPAEADVVLQVVWNCIASGEYDAREKICTALKDWSHPDVEPVKAVPTGAGG